MYFRRALLSALVVLLVLPTLYAQTITSGDITGTVSDPTGAIVPGATVILKEVNTGDSRTVQSNSVGSYRFNLLKPGTYQIYSTAPGLKSDIVARVAVAVGQVQTVNIVLKPEEAKEVVTVSESSAPLLQTENANVASNFNSQQMEKLPAPGGDITTVAFTIPGIVVSTAGGGGYGNFSSNGLPGTSNLFTLNGNDNMDPYLNLNNSGASNLTIGSNEIEQATVVQNAYSGQYGRQAGAQLNFVTKSGTNAYHGDLLYNYNGSFLNANDFFANSSGTPKARALSNQYAASLGGRIIRDKLFFFADTEGIRYVMPTTGVVTTPSSALQQYMLTNLPAAQRPFYQKAFDLYNGAPGHDRAVAVTNGDGQLQDSYGALGCGSLAGTPTGSGGVFGENVSCADAFGTNVVNQNKEWTLATRVDWNLSQTQKMFFRYKTDHGLQPTFTSDINPLFSAYSNQPSHEGQLNHTWIVSPRMVNNFIGSASWYSSIFTPTDMDATLAAFPVQINLYDGGSNGAGGFSQMGLSNQNYPQGRRSGQLQLIDDLSVELGQHSLKAGVNYRYNRIADLGNNRMLNSGRFRIFDLTEFAGGVLDGNNTGSTYQQRFTPFGTVHLRLANIGLYIQDEWAVTRNLKLTMAVRFDRTGNPTCTDDCFARLVSPFAELDKGANIPYSQSINTGLEHAFYDMEAVAIQPRFGVVYNPGWSKGTVIRTGIGVFSDMFPGTIAGNVFGNSPNSFIPALRAGLIDGRGAGSAPAIAAATGAAFANGFANGYTVAQIKSALAPTPFTEPPFFSIPSEVKNPKYLKWSFEVQQELSPKTVLSVSYIGNHGYDLFNMNAKANAYAASAAYQGFGGLPTSAPDPRFRIVTELTNSGWSNYDGLSASLRRSMAYGFQAQFGYTWSHALDTISNGGLGEFFGYNDSLTSQINPYDLRSLNYSNADYDIRHNFTADFTWDIPVNFENRALNTVLGGWSLGSKWYVRSGMPFSVYNSSLPGRLSSAVGGAVLATVLDPGVNTSCGRDAIDAACFGAAQFATTTTQTNFGNLPRNSFRGPGYFDVDATLFKTIKLAERVRFTLGANAFNLMNHANFANPSGNAGTSGLGIISETVAPPTSPYGSFQGSAVSGRVLVLTGRFSF